ncbi:flavodoxin family protein [Renibacterium salmoninarum]|uniref:flavodoxin family protein n=1 Tax=Renibacterium salmoninarum TaxID=1646 RepID=UPI0009B5B95A|nr:flavodoxin family protein [Renibacterium salmoninarum]
MAQAIAGELDAPVLAPADAVPKRIREADIVGFGSGIYWMNFHPELIQLIQNLPDITGRAAFIFATSGLPETPINRYTRRLKKLLESKGFRVMGTYTCRGLDTWGPFGVIGGVSKYHPNAQDLDLAIEFAKNLKLSV